MYLTALLSAVQEVGGETDRVTAGPTKQSGLSVLYVSCRRRLREALTPFITCITAI